MSFWLTAYPWIKALHIMAVIAWMAGLFYLPRLFVYHVERAQGDRERMAIFEVMERKLLRAIMNPAMIVTWICGIALAVIGGAAVYMSGWFALKFLFVCLLTMFHHWCGTERKRLESGNFAHKGRFYRMMNEVPTLLMIGIVLMVVIKPF